MLLSDDSGLVPDVPRAHRLLSAAAEAGHLGSLSALGREYLAGDVLPFRPEQGARYLVSAVRRGHEEARFSLVSAYLRANGLTNRYAGRREARLWLDGVIQADDSLALAERPPAPEPRREG
nr:hypothetical protein [Halomonas saccharevitans]